MRDEHNAGRDQKTLNMTGHGDHASESLSTGQQLGKDSELQNMRAEKQIYFGNIWHKVRTQ